MESLFIVILPSPPLSPGLPNRLAAIYYFLSFKFITDYLIAGFAEEADVPGLFIHLSIAAFVFSSSVYFGDFTNLALSPLALASPAESASWMIDVLFLVPPTLLELFLRSAPSLFLSSPAPISMDWLVLPDDLVALEADFLEGTLDMWVIINCNINPRTLR